MEKKFKIESFNKNFFLSLPQSSHLPPSQFFLSLSHSLCDCLLSSFSLFLILSGTTFSLLSLSFSVSVSSRSSWFHLLLFIELFLNHKKKTMEMVSIFFWALFWSSSSIHHFSFLYRLQLTLTKTCIWDLSFICLFLLWISFFFLVSQANWYCSLCFLQRSNGFFAWSYFSGV